MTEKMYHRKKGKFIDGLSDNNESHQNTLKRKRGNKWDSNVSDKLLNGFVWFYRGKKFMEKGNRMF